MTRRGNQRGALVFLLGTVMVACQSLSLDILPDASTARDGGVRDGASRDGGDRDVRVAGDARADSHTAHGDAGQPVDASGDSDASSCLDAAVSMLCPSGMQTSFVTMSAGANPGFTSGVAARTASQVLVFTSFVAGDAGSGNEIYVQEFDPVTGVASGTASPVYAPGPGEGLFLHDVATASSGEIVVLYGYGGFPEYGTKYTTTTSVASTEGPLGAVFFRPSCMNDPSAGLEVIGHWDQATGASDYGQAYAVWDDTAHVFALSWEYDTRVVFSMEDEYSMTVMTFTPDGHVAAGGVAVVPTDDSNWVATRSSQQGAVGRAGGVFGIAYASLTRGYPQMSFVGTPSGASIADVSVESLTMIYPPWVAAAGTAQGIVSVYDDTSHGEVSGGFFPVRGDAGVGTVTAFTIPSATQAIGGRAVGDNAGGGAGVALLYQGGLDFAFIGAGGAPSGSPTQQISHGYVVGDAFNIGSFGGSFVLGLYSSADHAVSAAVSGCTPP